MKKAVFKLEVNDDKVKKKALKTVSGLPGVDSVSMDVKNLTVIGDIDLVCILSKLRKLCNTEIVSVGPAKEPEMKDDEKKMKDDEKKPYANAVPPYYSYNAVPPNYYYNVDSAEEKPGPNACVIS